MSDNDCCSPDSSCCEPADSVPVQLQLDADTLRGQVRGDYAKVAQASDVGACCGGHRYQHP